MHETDERDPKRLPTIEFWVDFMQAAPDIHDGVQHFGVCEMVGGLPGVRYQVALSGHRVPQSGTSLKLSLGFGHSGFL